jgi:glycosyltransferase involved in cell wall biosynthesis
VHMKVLHLQKVSGIGGSERHLLTLLPELRTKGLEVRMCVLAAPGYADFVRLLGSSIDVEILSAGTQLNPLLPWALSKTVRSFRPNIIHTHLIHANFYGQLIAAFQRVPSVSSVHGTSSFYRREPYRTVARFGGHASKRTIAISKHVAAYISELGLAPLTHIRTIPYGINLDEWKVTLPQRRAIRREWALKDDEVVISVASRLVPDKGHDILIEAVARATTRIPGLRLLIAGTGPLRAYLESKATKELPAGVAKFLGHIADVRRVMAASDILAVPTQPNLGEGFGLAALEAMACGLPVVASALGGLNEVVANGQTGFLVSPPAVPQWVDSLVQLGRSDELRRRMGSWGQVLVSQKFSVDSMVNSTIAVYEEALHA